MTTSHSETALDELERLPLEPASPYIDRTEVDIFQQELLDWTLCSEEPDYMEVCTSELEKSSTGERFQVTYIRQHRRYFDPDNAFIDDENLVRSIERTTGRINYVHKEIMNARIA